VREPAAASPVVERKPGTYGCHSLWVSGKGAGQSIEGAGSESIVVVEEEDMPPACLGKAAVPRSGSLRISLEEDGPDSRIFARGPQPVPGPIRGAVIDDH
jgi:hypothetical protein